MGDERSVELKRAPRISLKLRVGCALMLGAVVTTAPAVCPQPTALAWTVVAERELPERLFIQGFEIDSDGWWLSSGGYGQSELYVAPPDAAKPPRTAPVPNRVFAEGISRRHDEIWMLSWQSERAWVFDTETLALKHHRRYAGEGWGLDWEPRSDRFLMSNGSDILNWRSPKDFQSTSSLAVRRVNAPVHRLNELEIVGTHVFANVWLTDHIVRIRLDDGCVDGDLDLRLLWGMRRRPQGADVLNGIAWDEANARLWVTGKRWGRAFALQLGSDAQSASAPETPTP